MDDLAHQAIQAAIRGEWKTAESLNKRILDDDPNDIETLLRLANAACQLGKIKEATEIYKNILKLEPHNLFANRGIDKITNLKKLLPNGISKSKNGVKSTRKINLIQHPLNNSFLEEPGKTKTVTLVYTAPTKVVAALDTGEPVNLIAKPHRISVATEAGVYVGRLPDNLSARLLGLIKGGNEYDAAVRSVNGNNVKIFVRETLRCTRFATTPSFPSEEFGNTHEA